MTEGKLGPSRQPAAFLAEPPPRRWAYVQGVAATALKLFAVLGDEYADVDPEIRRKTLGHADQAMTSHYTHIEAQAHRAAAEAVARLVEREP